MRMRENQIFNIDNGQPTIKVEDTDAHKHADMKSSVAGSERTAALESYSPTRAEYVDTNNGSLMRSGSPSMVSPIKNVQIDLTSSDRMTDKMVNSLNKSDHLSVLSLGSIQTRNVKAHKAIPVESDGKENDLNDSLIDKNATARSIKHSRSHSVPYITEQLVKKIMLLNT